LAWRIPNTVEADFCVEALNEAIHKFGPPEIMNTDQGSQFTSFSWTDRLFRTGARVSMDGKGGFLDNIFIDRLWRTLKYKCVYLYAWETGSEAKVVIQKWMIFYNHQRPHSALGGRPPAVVYWRRSETTNLDQQVQRVALFMPDPVQSMGSMYVYDASLADPSCKVANRIIQNLGGRGEENCHRST
jgi:putative transposase